MLLYIEELKEDFTNLRKSKEASLGGCSVSMMQIISIINGLFRDLENEGNLEEATTKAIYYNLRAQYLKEYEASRELWRKIERSGNDEK